MYDIKWGGYANIFDFQNLRDMVETLRDINYT